MVTYGCLINVHITAHSIRDRDRAITIFARLLGAGYVDNKDGIWGDCREVDTVFSHWTNPTNVLLFRRLCQLIVRLRAALNQKALLLEYFTPNTRFAVIVESHDTYQDVFNQVLLQIRPDLPDWLDPLPIAV